MQIMVYGAKDLPGVGRREGSSCLHTATLCTLCTLSSNLSSIACKHGTLVARWVVGLLHGDSHACNPQHMQTHCMCRPLSMRLVSMPCALLGLQYSMMLLDGAYSHTLLSSMRSHNSHLQ